MLTVACVLKSGGIYAPRHVERLRVMVADYLVARHRFRCLSDIIRTDGRMREWEPLRDELLGWWAKIELFRPGLFQGRVLYLDLDVTVVGPLDDLARFDAPFVAMKDPWRDCLNSSVMAWDAGAADRIYMDFTPHEMTKPGGDQAWITECMSGAATFPRAWCPSFKHDCRFSVPRGAKVVVYHGTPKPWDSRKGLVFA
jgi:hypothetical protein